MDVIDVVETDAVVETAATTKPRRPLPEHCFACGTPVKGPYCYACGQKNDNCRRSILSLAGESVGDFVAFDGRALRTLRSIAIRPGKHVREYGDGRRSPYSPPVRFFLVISLVFFTTLTFSGTHLMSIYPEITVDELGERDGIKVVPSILDDGKIKPFTDDERAYIQNAIGLNDIAGDDDGIIDVNGRIFTADTLFERFLVTMENPSAFNGALNNSIPKLMIILIPLMALLGVLFIRGKNAMIYDHLLVALNTHSMMFLVLTVAVIGSLALPVISRGVYAWMFFAGIPLYYFAAVKGAFGRGWIKTSFAVLVAFFVYSLAMVIGLAMVTGISLLGVL